VQDRKDILSFLSIYLAFSSLEYKLTDLRIYSLIHSHSHMGNTTDTKLRDPHEDASQPQPQPQSVQQPISMSDNKTNEQEEEPTSQEEEQQQQQDATATITASSSGRVLRVRKKKIPPSDLLSEHFNLDYSSYIQKLGKETVDQVLLEALTDFGSVELDAELAKLQSPSSKRRRGRKAGSSSSGGGPAKKKLKLGTKVYKSFDIHGYFLGEVTAINGSYYHVIYEDGDAEDMTYDEVMQWKVKDTSVKKPRVNKKKVVVEEEEEEEEEDNLSVTLDVDLDPAEITLKALTAVAADDDED